MNRGVSIIASLKPHKLKVNSFHQRKFTSSTVNLTVQQHKVVLKNDVNINYGIVGTGPNTIFCMPGIYGTIETDFEPIMTKFNPNKFTVICWDPPGYGKSRPPDKVVGKSPYATEADKAIELLEKLGIQKYSILGWSNGGAAGAHIAAAQSNKVDKFIFWGSPAFIHDFSVKLSEMMQDEKNWIPERWQAMIKIYGEPYLRDMIQQFDVYVKDCFKSGRFRLDLLLPQIKAPTLIIHGKRDMMCPMVHPEKYKELIQNSKLEVWPDGEHDLHLCFPDKFVKRVEKFILTSQ